MYLGPDSAIPFASAIAAVLGVAALFWQRTKAVVKGAVRWVGRLAGKK